MSRGVGLPILPELPALPETTGSVVECRRQRAPVTRRQGDPDTVVDVVDVSRFWRTSNAMLTYAVAAGLGFLAPDLTFFIAMLVSIVLYYALIQMRTRNTYSQPEGDEAGPQVTADQLSARATQPSCE